MLTTRYKATFNRWLEVPARKLCQLGVSPMALTWSGPVLTAAVCWVFLSTRSRLLFCLLIPLAALTDALDGPVARLSGKVTKEGAYADAMADRIVEVLVIGSAALVTDTGSLAYLFLAGSFLVSYAKARAAIEVPVSNTEWPDLAERTERLVIFWAGLFLSAVLPWKPAGHDLFYWSLCFLNAIVCVTLVQRIQRALRLIRERA